MRTEPYRPTKFLPINNVCSLTSLGKSCIYDKISRGEFPKPRQLTKGRVGWLESDIESWIESRPVADADIAA